MDGWTLGLNMLFPRDWHSQGCYIMTKSLIIPLRLTHVCFFTPMCLKCPCLSLVVHKSFRFALRGSGRSAKSGILRDGCLWVGARGTSVWPGSAVILNPALVVLDKAHLALRANPCSSQKWLLQNTLESARTLVNQQQPRKKEKKSFVTVHLCICVLSVLSI